MFQKIELKANSVRNAGDNRRPQHSCNETLKSTSQVAIEHGLESELEKRSLNTKKYDSSKLITYQRRKHRTRNERNLQLFIINILRGEVNLAKLKEKSLEEICEFQIDINELYKEPNGGVFVR